MSLCDFENSWLTDAMDTLLKPALKVRQLAGMTVIAIFAVATMVAVTTPSKAQTAADAAPEEPGASRVAPKAIDPDTGETIARPTDPDTADAAGATDNKEEEEYFELDSPELKARELENLYAYLATSPDAPTAQRIASAIERLWLDPGSDTISVLMERAIKAANAKKLDIALQLMDAVVELAPDYAEGWNRRAFIYFTQQEHTRAMGDLRRALALDPNHFKAMDGLAKVMLAIGQKKGALQALEKLREIHPYSPGLDRTIEELKRDVEGQGI